MQSLENIYLRKKRTRSAGGGENATKLQEEPKLIIDKNKNTCSIFRRKGELILFDNCPNSFHPYCLKLRKSNIPRKLLVLS